MTQAEIRKVILDNPTLPIYTYVDSDIFSEDYCGYLGGEIRHAEVKEVVICTIYGKNRIINKNDISELAEFLQWKAEDFWGSQTNAVYDQKVDEYITGLQWQKAVLLSVSEMSELKPIDLPYEV